MTRALLLENPHSIADDIFAKFGIEVTRVTGALSEDDLIDALDGVDYLGLRSKTEVTERVLRARPNLRLSVPSASAPTRSTWLRPPRWASPCSMPPTPTRAPSSS